MTPKGHKSEKHAWGSQLARLCCGELLGQHAAPDRVEYVPDPHAVRFNGDPGYHPIDFPLQDSEPEDLAAHATELVGRYRQHITREPHRPIDPTKTR
jgi:hypothetical protein